MASLERKTMAGGWDKRSYKEVRKKIVRFVETDEAGIEHSTASTSHWQCKKNRGNHVLVHVPPIGVPNQYGGDRIQYWADSWSEEEYKRKTADGSWWFKPRKVFRCTACGKMETQELGVV